MVELDIPELTTEQIETLCQTAENAARKHILSKVPNKNIEHLDISVEANGTKPINITVEINLELSPQTKNINLQTLVKQATNEAHKAIENFLRKLK
jgi:DNA-binding protein YbaB